MKISVAPTVAQALAEAKPVVAMESTVYSSLGLPLPANREAYLAAVQNVASQAAVGAVTAVLAGEVKVGLSRPELAQLLGQAGGSATTDTANGAGSQAGNLDAASPTPQKVSIGDLPIAIAQKWALGATTVSASLAIAHQAGIKVFATGGIGGVHRENPADVSADLWALSRYPVATVCSGVKAFLDLPATFERLETLGVAVVGYQTHQFPAFWSRESNIAVHHRIDTAAEAAEIVRQLNASAVLFVVPPPAEVALAWVELEAAVESALAMVAAEGIQGGAVTPFILQQISQATGGQTLPANIALVANNASVAAEIAACLSVISA